MDTRAVTGPLCVRQKLEKLLVEDLFSPKRTQWSGIGRDPHREFDVCSGPGPNRNCSAGYVNLVSAGIDPNFEGQPVSGIQRGALDPHSAEAVGACLRQGGSEARPEPIDSSCAESDKMPVQLSDRQPGQCCY